MKYMVGLNYTNQALLDTILQNKNNIYEVYFSWSSFANGRSNQLMQENFTPWEMQELQLSALKTLSAEKTALNLLLNANCYGAESQSRSFFEKIGTAVDYIQGNFGLHSVTTTSPLIAKFIHNNFENIDVRASVNMEIGSVQGMDYLSKYFDSYYMKREFNRDFAKIKQLTDWCRENGKRLYMLANSGCLNYCSAHNFHDNLVAHETEISKMDNAYQFGGICKEYLSDEKHFQSLIQDTNFVRPEDIAKYEEFFDAVKLATRVHKNPSVVVNSYIRQKYSGNILALLEPEHNIYPYIVENGEPLRLVKIDKKITEVYNADK